MKYRKTKQTVLIKINYIGVKLIINPTDNLDIQADISGSVDTPY